MSEQREHEEYNFTLIIEGDVESKMDELFEGGLR